MLLSHVDLWIILLSKKVIECFFHALASDPLCRDAVEENRPPEQQDEDSEEQSEARHDLSKLQEVRMKRTMKRFRRMRSDQELHNFTKRLPLQS